MRSLLVEVGCEELPYHLTRAAITYISQAFCASLKSLEIAYSEPELFVTPRRLAMLFGEVEEQGPSKEVEEKGPPKSACFDASGNPTKALQGFASKIGIEASQVVFKEISGGVYATATRQVQGRTIQEAVESELPKAILTFPHSHSMRWDETGVSWSRPIRWIVALLDDTVVAVSIGKVKSDRFTRSARPERIRQVSIPTATDYPKILSDLGIIGNLDERKAYIYSQAQKLANENGFVAVYDEDLLDEVASIVERPQITVGQFPYDYLDSAPDLVLKSVLIGDLRFVPFTTKDGKLTNSFALTVNGPQSITDTVMKGELKVLLGRLSDAKFFYAEDGKHTLEYFNEKLSGIAFMKGLGTLADKKLRLEKIAQELSSAYGIDTKASVLAASLAKADLATAMVHEHDELQGKIGGLYAQQDDVTPEICAAISEHYQPSGETDSIAKSQLGQFLSLVDKCDSLQNLVNAGNLPKGSADPFGVRRLAIGIIRILLEGDKKYNLVEFLTAASRHAFKQNPEGVAKALEFITTRLENYLRGKGFRYDVVRAAISPGIDDLKHVQDSIAAMESVYDSPQFAGVVATAKRLNNILKDYKNPAKYNVSDFVEDVEKSFEKECVAVFEKVCKTESAKDKTIALFELTDKAEKYFDTIMVNAEDEKVRANRKNFLSWLLAQFKSVSDFTEIAI